MKLIYAGSPLTSRKQEKALSRNNFIDFLISLVKKRNRTQNIYIESGFILFLFAGCMKESVYAHPIGLLAFSVCFSVRTLMFQPYLLFPARTLCSG